MNHKIIAIHGNHKRALIITDASLAFMDTQFGLSVEEPQLPVPNGEKVVPVINRLLMLKQLHNHYQVVVSINDWHSHKPLFNEFNITSVKRYGGAKQAFVDKVDTYYGQDSVWPSESLAGTFTADIHPNINRTLIDCFLRKGLNPDSHPYGGFEFSVGQTNGLSQMLKALDIRQTDHVGLAENYCLRGSGDSTLKEDFITAVVSDGTKGIDQPPGQLAKDRAAMKKSGMIYIESNDILARYKATTKTLDAHSRKFLDFQRQQLKALIKAMDAFPSGV